MSDQTSQKLSARNRVRLADELCRRYQGTSGFLGRMRYWRKKYLWQLFVGGAQLAKRIIDMSVAAIMMAALVPLFLVVSLCIKLTDGGPILFWQTRVGKWGREFSCPKFRSMCTNAEALKDKLLEDNQHGSAGVTFKMKRDPRVTWIGRIIRKLSIDELPQLMSIWNGDMSLVGPRPPVPREVENYTLADRRRLDVLPGLTCIWQVSGRGDIPFDQQVQLDVDYIESRSLWVDFKLLVMTIPAVLLGKGAY